MAEKKQRGKRLIKCLACDQVTRQQGSHAAQITPRLFYTSLGQLIVPQPVFGRICNKCVELLGYHRKNQKKVAK